MNLHVEWLDGEREPKNAPNPKYPKGVDLTVPAGRQHCSTALPYPAKRCGVYIVTCETCGIKIAVTTAGRPDDPRSVQVPCKGH